jgi:hypothetical protein
MKTTIYVLGVLLSISWVSCKDDDGKIIDDQGLTIEQSDFLQILYQEEKLAHDVYTAFYELHAFHPFDHIRGSETQHMERVAGLMTTYGIEIPTLEEGVFTVSAYQTAYDEWMQIGQDGLEALKIGGYIEELDILDLQEAYDTLDMPEDVQLALQDLLKGSENHLRAFNRFMEMEYDYDYQPQLMSRAQFDEIIGS